MSSSTGKLDTKSFPNVPFHGSSPVGNAIYSGHSQSGVNGQIVNGNGLLSGDSLDNHKNKDIAHIYSKTDSITKTEQLDIKDKDVLQAVEGIVFFQQALLCRNQTNTDMESVSINKGSSQKQVEKDLPRTTTSSADGASLCVPNADIPNTGIKLEKMEAMEIQMKRRLMDLKKRYQQKQSELNKLQTKSRKRKHSKNNAQNSKRKAKSLSESDETSTCTEQNNITTRCLPAAAACKDPVQSAQPPISPCPVDDDVQASGRKKRKLNKPKKIKTQSQSSENQFSEPDDDRQNGDGHHQPARAQHSSSMLRVPDLVEGLRILMKNEDSLLSAGKLKLIHPPDVYGVLVDGDRHRNRPIVLCQDEILRNCVLDRKVTANVPVGTRVAAYWSERMHCLYPGYVISEVEKDHVHIDFDDGDSAVIEIKHIRSLPKNFMSSNDKKGKSSVASDRPLTIEAPFKSRNWSKSDRVITQPAAKKSDDKSWTWSGPRIESDECNGITKKIFYRAVIRDNVVVSCGDCAVFLSSGRPRLPYIGLVESMWESWAKTMVVRVRWFYHPEEIAVTRRKHHKKNALYKSSHIDENDVQTISHPCYVLSREEYIKRKHCNNGKRNYYYYCAGMYDPSNGQIIEEFKDNES